MKYRIAIPNRDDLAGNELRAISKPRKSLYQITRNQTQIKRKKDTTK